VLTKHPVITIDNAGKRWITDWAYGASAQGPLITRSLGASGNPVWFRKPINNENKCLLIL